MTARTCGAEASRTKHSSSAALPIVRPLAPNHRASAMAPRSTCPTAASTAACVGAATSGPRVDHHVLDERVVLERVLRAVLTPTGLLDAAVRGLRREREVL